MNSLKTFAFCLICATAFCTAEAVEPPFLDHAFTQQNSENIVEKGILHKGPRGHRGKKGHRGRKGVTGPQGDTGKRGNTGHKGHKGPSGVQGVTGAPGATGATGATGAPGATGATGSTGPTGSAFVSAFGSAALRGQFQDNISSQPLPFTVPIDKGIDDQFNNITFNSVTHEFTVGMTGDYAIDYFLQVVHVGATGPVPTLDGPPVTMEISFTPSAPPELVEDELIPTTIYASPWTPAAFPYTGVSSGTKHIVRHLSAGTTAKLVITKLPVEELGAGATGILPTFLDAFDPNEPDKIVAYVAIHKID